jgi:hypothetical protein
MKKILFFLLAFIITQTAFAFNFQKGWNLASTAELKNIQTISNLSLEQNLDDIWMMHSNNGSWCTVKKNHSKEGIPLCEMKNINDYKTPVWLLAKDDVKGGPFTFTIEDQDRQGNSISVQGNTASILFVPFNTSSINIKAKTDSESSTIQFSFNKNECSSDNIPENLDKNLSKNISLTYAKDQTTCTVTAKNGDIIRNIEISECKENQSVGDSGKRCDDTGSSDNTNQDNSNDNTGNAP